MNLLNVNDYARDNQISALKDRIIELERQNNELSDIIIRDQSEISRLYARIQNELEPRLLAEKRYYDAFVSTDRAAESECAFCEKVDELVNIVAENQSLIEREYISGDIYQIILDCVKHHIKLSEDDQCLPISSDSSVPPLENGSSEFAIIESIDDYDRAWFDWSMRLYQKIKNQIDEQQNNNESENK